MDWIKYDGTNPPTDNGEYRWYIEIAPGHGWYRIERGHNVPAVFNDKPVAYIKLPVYTPPEPDLLPCRCGGDARKYENAGTLQCGECGALIYHRDPKECRRMWNASMAETEGETFKRRCDGVAKLASHHSENKPEPETTDEFLDRVAAEPDDMPDEIWAGVVRNDQPYKHGNWFEEPQPSVPSYTNYRKVTECVWVVFQDKAYIHICDGTIPIKYHPHWESYTHCPYCGQSVRVEI